MKRFLVITAFLGALLIIIGAIFAWVSTLDYIQAPEFAWSQTGLYFEWTGLGYAVGFVIGLAGAIISAICGLIAKPRLIWIALIASAVFYSVPFILGAIYIPYKEQLYPLVHPNAGYAESIGWAVFLLPGIIALIEAAVIGRANKTNEQMRKSI